MSSSAIWLSYDLGLRGDYPSLYTWLDSNGAEECGDSVAFLNYIHEGDLKDALKADFGRAVAVDNSTRIYLIYRDAQTEKLKGTFIFGRRHAAPWTGYAVKVAQPVEPADGDSASYQIHEVYYDDDGHIAGWTAEPVSLYGESLPELREEVRHFLQACRRPVLEERELDGKTVLVEDEDDSPINAGHSFEFMDRASVATDYVYQFLGSHPLIRQEPTLAALYLKAEAALADLYQEAGRLEFERAQGVAADER